VLYVGIDGGGSRFERIAQRVVAKRRDGRVVVVIERVVERSQVHGIIVTRRTHDAANFWSIKSPNRILEAADSFVPKRPNTNNSMVGGRHERSVGDDFAAIDRDLISWEDAPSSINDDFAAIDRDLITWDSDSESDDTVEYTKSAAAASAATAPANKRASTDVRAPEAKRSTAVVARENLLERVRSLQPPAALPPTRVSTTTVNAAGIPSSKSTAAVVITAAAPVKPASVGPDADRYRIAGMTGEQVNPIYESVRDRRNQLEERRRVRLSDRRSLAVLVSPFDDWRQSPLTAMARIANERGDYERIRNRTIDLAVELPPHIVNNRTLAFRHVFIEVINRIRQRATDYVVKTRSEAEANALRQDVGRYLNRVGVERGDNENEVTEAEIDAEIRRRTLDRNVRDSVPAAAAGSDNDAAVKRYYEPILQAFTETINRESFDRLPFIGEEIHEYFDKYVERQFERARAQNDDDDDETPTDEFYRMIVEMYTLPAMAGDWFSDWIQRRGLARPIGNERVDSVDREALLSVRRKLNELVTGTPSDENFDVTRGRQRPSVATNARALLTIGGVQDRFERAVYAQLARANNTTVDAIVRSLAYVKEDLTASSARFTSLEDAQAATRVFRAAHEYESLKTTLDRDIARINEQLDAIPSTVEAPLVIERHVRGDMRPVVFTATLVPTDATADANTSQLTFNWYKRDDHRSEERLVRTSTPSGLTDILTLSQANVNNLPIAYSAAAGGYVRVEVTMTPRSEDDADNSAETTKIVSPVATVRILDVCVRDNVEFEVAPSSYRQFGECRWRSHPVTEQRQRELALRASRLPPSLSILKPNQTTTSVPVESDADLLRAAIGDRDTLRRERFTFEALIRRLGVRIVAAYTDRYGSAIVDELLDVFTGVEPGVGNTGVRLLIGSALSQDMVLNSTVIARMVSTYERIFGALFASINRLRNANNNGQFNGRLVANALVDDDPDTIATAFDVLRQPPQPTSIDTFATAIAQRQLRINADIIEPLQERSRQRLALSVGGHLKRPEDIPFGLTVAGLYQVALPALRYVLQQVDRRAVFSYIARLDTFVDVYADTSNAHRTNRAYLLETIGRGDPRRVDAEIAQRRAAARAHVYSMTKSALTGANGIWSSDQMRESALERQSFFVDIDGERVFWSAVQRANERAHTRAYLNAVTEREPILGPIRASLLHADVVDPLCTEADWEGVHSSTDDQPTLYAAVFDVESGAVSTIRGSQRVRSGYNFDDLHAYIERAIVDFQKILSSEPGAIGARMIAQRRAARAIFVFNTLALFAPDRDDSDGVRTLSAHDIMMRFNRLSIEETKLHTPKMDGGALVRGILAAT